VPSFLRHSVVLLVVIVIYCPADLLEIYTAVSVNRNPIHIVNYVNQKKLVSTTWGITIDSN